MEGPSSRKSQGSAEAGGVDWGHYEGGLMRGADHSRQAAWPGCGGGGEVVDMVSSAVMHTAKRVGPYRLRALVVNRGWVVSNRYGMRLMTGGGCAFSCRLARGCMLRMSQYGRYRSHYGL